MPLSCWNGTSACRMHGSALAACRRSSPSSSSPNWTTFQDRPPLQAVMYWSSAISASRSAWATSSPWTKVAANSNGSSSSRNTEALVRQANSSITCCRQQQSSATEGLASTSCPPGSLPWPSGEESASPRARRTGTTASQWTSSPSSSPTEAQPPHPSSSPALGCSGASGAARLGCPEGPSKAGHRLVAVDRRIVLQRDYVICCSVVGD